MGKWKVTDEIYSMILWIFSILLFIVLCQVLQYEEKMMSDEIGEVLNKSDFDLLFFFLLYPRILHVSICPWTYGLQKWNRLARGLATNRLLHGKTFVMKNIVMYSFAMMHSAATPRAKCMNISRMVITPKLLRGLKSTVMWLLLQANSKWSSCPEYQWQNVTESYTS